MSVFTILPYLHRATELVPIRRSYSPADNAVLDKYGSRPINRMIIGRTPIKKFIGTALNVISLGQWQKAMAKYGYDKLFHLFLLVQVIMPNGALQDLIIEKNETPRIYVAPKSYSDDTEFQPVREAYSGNIRTLLDTAKAEMGDGFWVYDPFTNNCQNFLLHVLGDSGLLNQKNMDFIKQDITSIVDEQPDHVHRVARGVTDLARRLRTVTGRGLNAQGVDGRS